MYLSFKLYLSNEASNELLPKTKVVDLEILSKFGIQNFFIWGHVEGENFSFQTGVLNFALFTKLPLPPSPHTSLSVLAVTTAFAGAAGHAPRPSPLRASGVSLKLRDIATRRHPVRARRGPPSKRHGDAVSLRPTASRPPRRLDSPGPFPRAPSRPHPPLLPSWARAPRPASPCCRERPPPPPSAPPPPSSPWSSPLHPFPRQTDPVASSLDLRWCSPTRSPPPRATGPPPPPPTAAAAAPAPRSRRLRPSRAQPRPPRGCSRRPLAPPPIPPRRRPPQVPESGRPPPPLSPSPARGLSARKTLLPGASAQKDHFSFLCFQSSQLVNSI